MHKNIYLRFKGREIVHIDLALIGSGLVLGAIIGALCFCASGCQSAARIQSRTVAAQNAVDTHFDAVDGTATALESGTIEPKAAADDLHASAASGKGANATAKAGVAELAARAAKAETALQDRARNRIEWALIAAGFLAWGAAGFLAYTAFQGGAVVGSAFRKGGLIAALAVAGCAFFAAAVYFDRILTIGAWALGLAAVVAIVAGYLHHRKTLGEKNDAEEVLWAVGNFAKDEAIAGGKDALKFDDPRLHSAAERLLTESQFKKWQEFLAAKNPHLL